MLNGRERGREIKSSDSFNKLETRRVAPGKRKHDNLVPLASGGNSPKTGYNPEPEDARGDL